MARAGAFSVDDRNLVGRTDVDDDPEARAIVDAVLAGDRDAFRRLVERESTPVVRACYRVLGDLHDAEDAAQEAFVTAFRSLATWRGEGPFGAWIARIAVRIAMRQGGRRRPVAWIHPSDPESAHPEGGFGTDADRRTGTSLAAQAMAGAGRHDPAAISLRGERAADLRRAVAVLDEPYREVVALRFFGELSLAEIALASGRPIGTVKTHLRRGLLRLRRDLDMTDTTS